VGAQRGARAVVAALGGDQRKEALRGLIRGVAEGGVAQGGGDDVGEHGGRGRAHHGRRGGVGLRGGAADGGVREGRAGLGEGARGLGGAEVLRAHRQIRVKRAGREEPLEGRGAARGDPARGVDQRVVFGEGRVARGRTIAARSREGAVGSEEKAFAEHEALQRGGGVGQHRELAEAPAHGRAAGKHDAQRAPFGATQERDVILGEGGQSHRVAPIPREKQGDRRARRARYEGRFGLVADPHDRPRELHDLPTPTDPNEHFGRHGSSSWVPAGIAPPGAKGQRGNGVRARANRYDSASRPRPRGARAVPDARPRTSSVAT
jgi:hypothetical protein